MKTFQEQFMGLTTKHRQEIAGHAGLSLGYILKHMYVSHGNPVFRFHNAVAMDAASGGLIPFMQHTETKHCADVIDWGFVRSRLNASHRQGVI